MTFVNESVELAQFIRGVDLSVWVTTTSKKQYHLAGMIVPSLQQSDGQVRVVNTGF